MFTTGAVYFRGKYYHLLCLGFCGLGVVALLVVVALRVVGTLVALVALLVVVALVLVQRPEPLLEMESLLRVTTLRRLYLNSGVRNETIEIRPSENEDRLDEERRS